jgi:hypothetical protein
VGEGDPGGQHQGGVSRLPAARYSNCVYLLVRVLEKAGLKYTDVELVFLPPADGRAGFEKGVIKAWVIWEPYRTAAEMSLGAPTLRDAVPDFRRSGVRFRAAVR